MAPVAEAVRPSRRLAPQPPRHDATDDTFSTSAPNQATQAQLTGEARLRTADVGPLQRAAGNRAVTQLIAAQRQTTDLATPAAEHVNVVNTVHELRRAVDQTNTEMRGSWFWGKHPVHPVKFDVVDRSLTNLAPSQVREIAAEYKRETGHELREDLLGFSPDYLNRPVPSELNPAQRYRVAALLEGTALEPTGAATSAVAAGAVPVTWINTGPVGSGAALKALPSLPAVNPDGSPSTELSDVAKVVRRNRAAADAAEIKILIGKDDEESRKQIMRMLRKSAADNSWVASLYKTQFDEDLTDAVGDLPGFWKQRALALIHGDWTVADAYALVIVRGKIEDAMTDLVLEDDEDKVKAKVRALLDELEGILAGINREAAAGGLDSVKAVLAVHLPEAGEGGPSVDELLRKDFLAPIEMSVIDAMAKGDPVEEAAARLNRLEDAKDLKPDDVTSTLRGLRARADQDVRGELRERASELAKTTPPHALAQVLESVTSGAARAIDNRAHVYIARFITRFDTLGAASGPGHRKFEEVLESWDNRDHDVVDQLVREGGTLKPVEELEYAMTKKEPDLDAVINVLKGLAPAGRRKVVAEYDAGAGKAGRPTLSDSVKGKVMTLAQSSTFINVTQYLPGGSPTVANIVIQKPRTDKEAAIQELIEAPDPGGQAELNWTYKWTRDTFERAIQAGGLTGKMADTVGGKREVRETLEDSHRALTDAMIEFRKASEAGDGAGQMAAILKARDARAAMSVDKDAYVAATDALRAAIANAIAIAVDIALTVLLPGVGHLAGAAISLAVNIGTKAAIMGDQYDWAMLKGDLIGSAIGFGLGAPSRVFGEEAAGIVGRKLAGAGEQLGFAVSAEVKAGAQKLAGQAFEVGATTVATNEALGQDATEGLDVAYGVALAKGGLGRARAGKKKAGAGTTTDEPTAKPTDEPTAKPTEEPTKRTTDEEGTTGARGRATADEPTTTRAGDEPEGPRAADADDTADTDAEVTKRTPMALEEGKPVPKNPEGHVLQIVGDNEVEAWRAYKKAINADPSREVALLYNHRLKQWAVVQGNEKMVPTTAAMRKMGWEAKETTLGRHSHPTGEGGDTSDPNLVPSGRGGDLPIIKGDASKGPATEGPHWSAIDVVVDGKPERTWVFYEKKTGYFTIYYPEGGGHASRSFPNVEAYHQWFKDKFHFEPGPSQNAGQGPAAASGGRGSGGGGDVGDKRTTTRPAPESDETARDIGDTRTTTRPAPESDETMIEIGDERTTTRPAPESDETARDIGDERTTTRPAPESDETATDIGDTRTTTRPAPEDLSKLAPDKFFDPSSDDPSGAATPALHVLDPANWTQVAVLAEGNNPKVVLRGPDGRLYLFKPAPSETVNPYGPDIGIQAGQRYRRSPAAVAIARGLGFDTPGAVVAEWHGDAGSLQEWRPDLAPDQPSTAADIDRFNKSQARKDLDALDFVMGSMDRHEGNFKIVYDGDTPRLTVYDNDAAFPSSDARYSTPDRSRVGPGAEQVGDLADFPREGYQREAPPQVSAALAERLRQFEANFPEAELRQYLTAPEVAGVRARLADLITEIKVGTIQVVP